MLTFGRTCLGILSLPLVGVAMFTFGILAAALHLVALPALFLWEKYRERRPLRTRNLDWPFH